MLLRLLARLAQVRVTVSYAVTVTCITVALYSLGPQVQDRVIRHVSTNLHNLSHGHFGTLLTSAFVIDAGPIYVWLPGLVCLLALAELTFRSRLLVATFAAGHIGATLLVAAGLTAAVELGWLPLSVSRATDVGMSYGAAAVLGSLTAAIPGRWRPAWLGWFLAVGVAVVAVGRDFTDVGHAVALALGMLVATRFRLQENWTLTRFVMLAGAAGFGYLVLASTDMLVATAAGLAGAVVGEALARLRSARVSAALSPSAVAHLRDYEAPARGDRLVQERVRRNHGAPHQVGETLVADRLAVTGPVRRAVAPVSNACEARIRHRL